MYIREFDFALFSKKSALETTINFPFAQYAVLLMENANFEFRILIFSLLRQMFEVPTDNLINI